MNEFGRERRRREARTFPCMSSRRVRVTPMPPSPKSCSQFMVMWGRHAGKRMNGAHSLVTLFRGGGPAIVSGSPRIFSAALRDQKRTEAQSAGSNLCSRFTQTGQKGRGKISNHDIKIRKLEEKNGNVRGWGGRGGAPCFWSELY